MEEDTREFGPDFSRGPRAAELGDQGRDRSMQSEGGGLQIGEKVAQRLNEISSALHDTAMRLGDGGSTAVGRYTDRIAESLHSAADYVENARTSKIAEDAKDFPRKPPELFVGAAAIAALMLGRFLRSDPPREPEPRDDHEPQEVGDG